MAEAQLVTPRSVGDVAIPSGYIFAAIGRLISSQLGRFAHLDHVDLIVWEKGKSEPTTTLKLTVPGI